MLNIESYKDGAVAQVSKLCESVTPGDAEIIGDIIQNTLAQFKADMIDLISVDCVAGVRDRLEQTLNLLRSA